MLSSFTSLKAKEELAQQLEEHLAAEKESKFWGGSKYFFKIVFLVAFGVVLSIGTQQLLYAIKSPLVSELSDYFSILPNSGLLKGSVPREKHSLDAQGTKVNVRVEQLLEELNAEKKKYLLYIKECSDLEQVQSASLRRLNTELESCQDDISHRPCVPEPCADPEPCPEAILSNELLAIGESGIADKDDSDASVREPEPVGCANVLFTVELEEMRKEKEEHLEEIERLKEKHHLYVEESGRKIKDYKEKINAMKDTSDKHSQYVKETSITIAKLQKEIHYVKSHPSAAAAGQPEPLRQLHG